MNILIRVENREDITRVEESLSALPLDLYFVSDDRRMLSILERMSLDAVLLGFSTDQNIVIHSIRNLKDHEVGSAVPVVLCCDNGESTGSAHIDDSVSVFEQFMSVIEHSYSVEVLWQAHSRSRSSFNSMSVR